MKITIIGTGGVGGYFGGRLAKAGSQVTFVARGNHLKAISNNGLKVISVDGDFIVSPANVTSDLSAVKNADLVIIGTKAWQVKDIAKDIASLLNEKTMILPLQNGVLAVEELAEFIPSTQIMGGLCKIFSMIKEPGVILHQGGPASITFGELNHQKTERAERLQTLFDNAGIKNYRTEYIEVELWKKFLMISSSALLAVTRTNYGELRTIPETRKLLEQLYTEIYSVGIAAQIKLPGDIIEKTMKAVDNFPAESNSSLTRDVLEGKPSEIEYQNGTVVKLGEKLGVPTPVNQFVYYSILPMEMKARNEKMLDK